MVKTIIIVAVVAILGYLVYNNTQRTTTESNSNDTQNVEDSENTINSGSNETVNEDTRGGDTYSGGVDAFVAYENKAMGYSIQRPDKWYWQHSIKSQIIDGDDTMLDNFATDPFIAPIAGAPQESRVSIVVFSRDPESLNDLTSGLESSQVSIVGQSSTRYEGVKNDSEKVIIYHFVKDDLVYILTYRKQNSTPEEEGVFENIVSSLKFN